MTDAAVATFVAETFDAFAWRMEGARNTAGQDRRLIVHHIGRLIRDVHDRIDHLTNFPAAAEAALGGDPDTEAAAAVLAMSREYGLRTSKEFGELIGLVLLALEEGGLYEHTGAEREEANHG